MNFRRGYYSELLLTESSLQLRCLIAAFTNFSFNVGEIGDDSSADEGPPAASWFGQLSHLNRLGAIRLRKVSGHFCVQTKVLKIENTGQLPPKISTKPYAK